MYDKKYLKVYLFLLIVLGQVTGFAQIPSMELDDPKLQSIIKRYLNKWDSLEETSLILEVYIMNGLADFPFEDPEIVDKIRPEIGKPVLIITEFVSLGKFVEDPPLFMTSLGDNLILIYNGLENIFKHTLTKKEIAKSLKKRRVFFDHHYPTWSIYLNNDKYIVLETGFKLFPN